VKEDAKDYECNIQKSDKPCFDKSPEKKGIEEKYDKTNEKVKCENRAVALHESHGAFKAL
jgi:hypothetical protein